RVAHPGAVGVPRDPPQVLTRLDDDVPWPDVRRWRQRALEWQLNPAGDPAVGGELVDPELMHPGRDGLARRERPLPVGVRLRLADGLVVDIDAQRRGGHGRAREPDLALV